MTTARPDTRLTSSPDRLDRYCEQTQCSLIRLSATSAWTLPRRVREIRCVEGRVWVTRPNDSRDFVLTPGQSMTVGGSGVVVQAVEDSILRV
jgi:hypothetical protein